MRGTNQSGTISRNGTATTKVFEALVEEHGMGVVCDHTIDYESARFSNGFMPLFQRACYPSWAPKSKVAHLNPGATTTT